MIISIHIPKTAGTTIANYLDYSFRRHIFFDYYEDRKWVVEREELIKHKEFLSNHFEVIHGHFHYLKYKDMFEEARYITCLRNPVERLLSNFRHVMREKNLNTPSYIFMKENGFDFFTFCNASGMLNASCQYLDGREIEDFDFVGISEQLDKSLVILSRILNKNLFIPHTGGEGSKVPRINQNIKGASNLKKIHKDIRKKVEILMAEEMDLYDRGLAYFKKLKKLYL